MRMRKCHIFVSVCTSKYRMKQKKTLIGVLMVEMKVSTRAHAQLVK